MAPRKEADPLVTRAEAVRMSSAAIQAFADEIPSDEGPLGELLEECIEGYFGRAFTVTALAGLYKGVPVGAGHLVTGARMLPHPGFIGKLSTHVVGDVVGALVGAVRDGRMSWEKEAVTLYLAAYWSRERGQSEHRNEIVCQTRMLARSAYGRETQAFIAGASDLLADPELFRLIAGLPAGGMLPMVSAWTEPFLDFVRRPILWGLEEEDAIGPPTTRRRAVDRIGRNEPCPCGSGKKYKRCCWTKDQERLQDSSDVAGVTRAELRQNLEEYLTRDRVLSLRAHELARLDARRIDPELYGIVLNQLIHLEEFDAARVFFEAVGADCTEGHFVDAAVRAGKLDKARAFLGIAPLPDEDWLGFSFRLLKEGIEQAPTLDLLEEEARKIVDKAAVDLAYDLLHSKWPCVGILVARGVAPTANLWDRNTLQEELGQARDRLDLPALDPTEGMQDLWGWGEESEFYDDVPLHPEPARQPKAAAGGDDDARQMLGKKEAELASLRQELSDLHRKLDEQASRSSGPEASLSPSAEPAAPADPRIAELRERVSRLRGELSQRHTERNQLRRQLERTLKRVGALEAERENVEKPPEIEADEDSDASLFDAPVTLSFRIPVFTKRFRSSAEAVPDPIRRRAVVVTSRIAAADENAFRGTRRLKADRDLYRQRIGREHRLIFRLHADELEAVDLVARKQLERTIRELSRS